MTTVKKLDVEEEEEEGGLELIPDWLARKLIKNYVCSNCWGDLSLDFDKNTQHGFYYVVCLRCGREDTRGYVTRYYADRRRNESHAEKMDVIPLLERCGIIKREPHSALENLKVLGF